MQNKTYSYPQAQHVVVCGDIHGGFDAIVGRLCTEYRITDAVLIVAGDCGFGFERTDAYERMYRRNVVRLRQSNNWIVFVRGNHDNPAYFQEERFSHERMRCIPDYSIVSAAGHNILCVGGAVSVDRRVRISGQEGRDLKEIAYWWPDEAPVFKTEYIAEIPEGMIDAVVTHTCPSFCNPQTKEGLWNWLKDDPTLDIDLNAERAVMDKLYEALSKRQQVKEWCYGHYHHSYHSIINNVRFTLLDIEELYPLR